MVDLLKQHVDRSQAVCVIALNRPEALNALHGALALELLCALAEAQADETVSAVLLYGEGQAFCGGGDHHDARPAAVPPEALDPEWTEELLSTLRHFEKPTVAVLHGLVADLGIDLALACTARVIEASCLLTDWRCRRGVLPPEPYLLPRFVGPAVAMEMLCLGKALNANEALRLGVATALAADGEGLNAALDLAGELGRGGDAPDPVETPMGDIAPRN